MDNISQIHEVSRALKENVFYPAHDKRTESPEYAKTHHELVVVQDRPCLVCGVKNSTLSDPTKNTVGAKAIETHHHLIEWALANAIDLDKFNVKIVGRLRLKNPTKYATDFTQEQMLAWVDHDEDNLWPLCDVHHRHALYGVHSITFPIWSAQDLVRSDFVYIK